MSPRRASVLYCLFIVVLTFAVAVAVYVTYQPPPLWPIRW